MIVAFRRLWPQPADPTPPCHPTPPASPRDARSPAASPDATHGWPPHRRPAASPNRRAMAWDRHPSADGSPPNPLRSTPPDLQKVGQHSTGSTWSGCTRSRHRVALDQARRLGPAAPPWTTRPSRASHAAPAQPPHPSQPRRLGAASGRRPPHPASHPPRTSRAASDPPAPRAGIRTRTGPANRPRPDHITTLVDQIRKNLFISDHHRGCIDQRLPVGSTTTKPTPSPEPQTTTDTPRRTTPPAKRPLIMPRVLSREGGLINAATRPTRAPARRSRRS
jgi:hypothetical protein